MKMRDRSFSYLENIEPVDASLWSNLGLGLFLPLAFYHVGGFKFRIQGRNPQNLQNWVLVVL